MVREPRGVARGRNVHLNVMFSANRSLDQLEAILHGRHHTTRSTWRCSFCVSRPNPSADGLPIGAIADGSAQPCLRHRRASSTAWNGPGWRSGSPTRTIGVGCSYAPLPRAGTSSLRSRPHPGTASDAVVQPVDRRDRATRSPAVEGAVGRRPRRVEVRELTPKIVVATVIVIPYGCRCVPPRRTRLPGDPGP